VKKTVPVTQSRWNGHCLNTRLILRPVLCDHYLTSDPSSFSFTSLSGEFTSSISTSGIDADWRRLVASRTGWCEGVASHPDTHFSMSASDLPWMLRFEHVCTSRSSWQMYTCKSSPFRTCAGRRRSIHTPENRSAWRNSTSRRSISLCR
jgi:hypothetical protein